MKRTRIAIVPVMVLMSHLITQRVLAERPATGLLPGPYDASGVTLLSRVPIEAFPEEEVPANDIWAYVSPNGREYAVVGLRHGTGFVDVTDPIRPLIVGYIPGETSTWRDMSTFGEFCFSVSQNGLALQVIDLRQIEIGLVSLHADATPGGFLYAHSITINPASGYAYVVLTNLTPKLVAIDVSDPLNPQYAGGWYDTNNLHDVFVTSYDEGPYAGREIAFAFAGNSGLFIIDVTDKSNMFRRSFLSYPGLAYCHQGWISADGRYLFVDDELDELDNHVDTTTTYIIDIQNLDQPKYVTSFTNGLPSVDHNLMVRGRFVFEANYSSGLRVYDACDINNVQEVGFFDTRPETDAPNFDGAWGVYSDLPSGVVLVSDRQRGLFVLDAAVTRVGDVNHDGSVDLTDITCVIDAFGGNFARCALEDVDIAPCEPDGIVDLQDILAVLDSFRGTN